MWCDIQKDCANSQYVRIPKIIAQLVVSFIKLFAHRKWPPTLPSFISLQHFDRQCDQK